MARDTRKTERPSRIADLEADALAARRARRRKTGWKRPRPILSLWARLTFLVAVIAVLVLFAVSLVSKAARPYREAGVQSRQLAQTRQASAALDIENAVLERRIAYLKTPEGVASEARKMGYLHPGEFPIVVEGLAQPNVPPSIPSVSTSTQPLSAPSAVPSSSAAHRFWRHLTGH